MSTGPEHRNGDRTAWHERVRRAAAALWVAGVTGVVQGADRSPFPGITIADAGNMTFEELLISVVHFAPGWVCSRQGSANILTAAATDATDAGWSFRGEFHVHGDGEPFAFRQEVTRTGDAAFTCRWQMTHPTGAPTNLLALDIRLPVGCYEDRRVELDEHVVELVAGTLETGLRRNGVRRVCIPTSRGALILSGDLVVSIQDGRGTGMPFFRVRLLFTPCEGTVRDARLSVGVSLHEPDATPLDLRTAANMGFRDETAGDGIGGWTDQGANDMRMLPTGLLRCATIPFSIVDPALNSGRSCMVFAGPEREGFPRTAEVPGNGTRAECLYILHATAWTPRAASRVGDITTVYTDGSAESAAMITGRDVGNWFRAVDLENGIVGWSGANSRSSVGLYVSKIALQPKPVESVRLTASGNAVWMVVGISLGDDVPLWRMRTKEYIFRDDTWRPFQHRLFTEPGSILDFSSLVDAPAGKYGPVVTRGGHFVFRDAPEKRIRFYGTNICHLANFQDRADSDALAAELARKGYNSVRLHHFGAQLPRRGGASSLDFDPAQLDRLDYLFSSLKQHGLYINIDLYTTRTVRKGEIAEIDRDVRLNEFKALVAISPSAMRNWKSYAEALLTHTNPYTGLAWKDDPALYGICLMNEANLSVHWNTAPDIEVLYRQRYEAWLAALGRTPAEAPAGSSPLFTRFIVELNRSMVAECAAFVRGLGTTALLTDLNYRQLLPENLLREPFDYVDNHVYWDLKTFMGEKWKLPYRHRQLKDTAKAAQSPRTPMPTRHVGKPFTVTEFNYCYPNHYRAEGGPIMGAYAALQDWDGLYRYCYAHQPMRTQSPAPLHYLENASDPINVLSDRIGVLLFLRGDAAAARRSVSYLYSDAVLDAPGMLSPATGRAGDAFSMLGLLYRVGCRNSAGTAGAYPDEVFAVACAPTWPEVNDRPGIFEDNPSLLTTLAVHGLLPRALHRPGDGLFVSETGELRLEPAAATFSAITDFTECFALAPGAERTGNTVSVRNGPSAHAVLCVSAMDGSPLRESRRILVIHLTDVMNTGVRFGNAEHTILEDWGGDPILVRQGSTAVRMHGTPKTLTVHALDLGGARRWQVPSRIDSDAFSFAAETCQSEGSCMAYEIVIGNAYQ